MLLSKIAAVALFVGAAVARYCKNRKPAKDWELFVYPNIDCDKGNDIIAIHSFGGNLGTSSSNYISLCINLKNAKEAKSIIFNARSKYYTLFLYSKSGCAGPIAVLDGSHATPDGVTEELKSFQVAQLRTVNRYRGGR